MQPRQPYQLQAGRQLQAKWQLIARIDELEQRAREASESRLKEQLRETIAGCRHKQCMMEEQESLLEQGLLRLEHAVAVLGSLTTQLSMLALRGECDVARLANSIDVEVQYVDAILLALDRVHMVRHEGGRKLADTST
jgi:hypothetical protein